MIVADDAVVPFLAVCQFINNIPLFVCQYDIPWFPRKRGERDFLVYALIIFAKNTINLVDVITYYRIAIRHYQSYRERFVIQIFLTFFIADSQILCWYKIGSIVVQFNEFTLTFSYIGHYFIDNDIHVIRGVG